MFINYLMMISLYLKKLKKKWLLINEYTYLSFYRMSFCIHFKYNPRGDDWNFQENTGIPSIWKHFRKNNPKGKFQIQVYGKNAINEAPICNIDSTGTILTIPGHKKHLVDTNENEEIILFGLQKYHPSPDDLDLSSATFSEEYNPTLGVNIYNNISFEQPPKRLIFVKYDLKTKKVTAEWNNIIKEIVIENGVVERIELYQPMALVCNSGIEQRLIWSQLHHSNSEKRTAACKMLREAASLTKVGGEPFNDQLSNHLQNIMI